MAEEIREGYWSWWALKGEVDRERRGKSLSTAGTKDRGQENLISGGFVGKDQMDKHRIRPVRRGRGVWGAFKSGRGFSTGEASEFVYNMFVTYHSPFGCQMHWRLSQFPKKYTGCHR